MLLAAGCGGRNPAPPQRPLPSDPEQVRLLPATRAALRSGQVLPTSSTGGCGVELWRIKTLADPAAAAVNLAPQLTTIATLAGEQAPAASSTRARAAPVETQAWLVQADLTGYKLEADGDYHLVLADQQGHTLIAEIPDPACAQGAATGGVASRVLAQVASVRAAFETAGHTASGACFNCLAEAVQVVGVGFFDKLHGQTGVAPNGVELHPVIGIRWGSPPPTPPVTTVGSTTTATTTSAATTSTAPIGTTTSTPSPSIPPWAGTGRGCRRYPGRFWYRHRPHHSCRRYYYTTP